MNGLIYRLAASRMRSVVRAFLGRLLLCGACAAAGVANASADPMPTWPMHGSSPSTNPPVFLWPAGKGPYKVEIEDSSGTRLVRQPSRNWLTLNRPLPLGDYRWRWNDEDSGPVPWMNFRMGLGATDFPIPDSKALLARVHGLPHPRSVSVDAIRRDASLQTITALRQAIATWQKLDLPSELKSPTTPLTPRDQNQLEADNRQLVFGEEHRILAAAWLWLLTGDPSALSEAKRRAMHVASWDLKGMTSFEVHDQAGRSVAWTLAIAYDWLHRDLASNERQILLLAIAPRLSGMLGASRFGIDNSHRLDRNPFDSHGVTALSRTALICAILAGTSAQSDRCFSEVVPRFLALPVPWGGANGGFANGTAYSHWGVLDTALPTLYLLSQTLGLDLLKQPWAREHGKYIAYFLPPGTPSGLFGDEAERRYPDVWATQAKVYAGMVPSALADWYARSQFGEQPLRFAMLLTPTRDWGKVSGRLPAGTPNAIHLPDVGWVAMHSDLGDRARTSIYFKSSPYGSYNHSHADQNSFVIHSQGKALAIDSGYYDFYGSPHWKDWYKQTRAHNAITFDGGQGQIHDTMKAKGRIVRFEHFAGFDITTGDATAAYGGLLTRAMRDIIYLRPKTVLIYDSLASDSPRTWEWNLHALSRVKGKGARAFEIEQDGVRMCVTMLVAPVGDITLTNRFSTEPTGNYSAQWHARYATEKKSREAKFLALLDIECSGVDVAVRQEGDGMRVEIGKRHISISNTRVEVEK